MSTVKDVAKLAGVSLGTVSNVLNGKTQNEELIERVEYAMKQLSYSPDATARSLKNTKSNTIGIILPDVTQKFHTDFLMELERLFREKGYNISVKFSRNNRLIERKSVESFWEMRMAGIILYSVLPQKAREEWKQIGTPILLVSRYNAADFPGDNIVLNYSDAFSQAVKALHRQGLENVALVIDRDLLSEAKLDRIFLESFPGSDRIKIVDGSRERGFQAMFELCLSCPRIDGIIAGSPEIGEGIKKALEMLKAGPVPVYVIKESSWIDDTGTYVGEISLSPKLVAQEAVGRIFHAIEAPQLHESITRYLPARFVETPPIQTGILSAREELRFAMYDCSSAHSLEMLAMIYERESGKRIHFDMYSYKELEELLYRRGEARDSRYDGFMMDITWLEGLVESGCVQNLDHLAKHLGNYLDGFIEGAVRDYGMYVESLYAIPFMSGAQILFYQKDLFENRTLQMRFRRKYNAELMPPETWSQFHTVAEFFTQEYTPDSPVRFGTSIPMSCNVYIAIEYLARLWSYGGQVFNSLGEVCINSTNARQALESLLKSYQYSSRRNLDSWNEVAAEFALGNSAMVILYSSDVGDINNYTKSRIAGNIGFAPVPGGTPVLGGWSLGLNRFCRRPEEAERFLLWACGNQNSIPLSLLGGSTLRQEYYTRPDLDNLEPWKQVVLVSNALSRKRAMPEILDESRFKNSIYTRIIPEEILGVVRGQWSAGQAVRQMEARIKTLVAGRREV